jgi:cellulose synthase/poly-beta-1,6-N-acetylglucosamine synthase-like glycosyltransferase
VDYPRDLLSFVLVNDGSSDRTAELMQRWCANFSNACVVDLPACVGKTAALQAALGASAPSELVIVLDADAAPARDCIAALVGSFDDARVGLASGYPQPGNSSDSFVARYTAIERWVYQLVIQSGKDRLGANPPANGGVCAIRRSALDDAGGFPVGRVAEDIELSFAITAKGWRTRWIASAVAREDVVTTRLAFWDQRQRWSRGMYAAAYRAGRLEDWLVAAGYSDRLVLLAAIVCVAMGDLAPWWLAAYFSAPLATVLIALHRAKARGKLAYLLAATVLVWLDVAAVVTSAWGQLRRKPLVWKPRRIRLQG